MQRLYQFTGIELPTIYLCKNFIEEEVKWGEGRRPIAYYTKIKLRTLVPIIYGGGSFFDLNSHNYWVAIYCHFPYKQTTWEQNRKDDQDRERNLEFRKTLLGDWNDYLNDFDLSSISYFDAEIEKDKNILNYMVNKEDSIWVFTPHYQTLTKDKSSANEGIVFVCASKINEKKVTGHRAQSRWKEIKSNKLT